MRYLILIISFVVLITSCKTSKKSNCEAYSQKEIKKDHQI
jgi:hypothetical protein